jgi:serine/threonine protein kinase
VKLLKREVLSNAAATVFRREVEILSSVEHETLLSLRGYVPVDSERGGGPAILTDFVSGGSLGDLLKKEQAKKIPSGWDDVQKLIVLYGISVGMLILQRNNIIHRNLKPNNILLNEAGEPKVADFGLWKLVDANKTASRTTDASTSSYMAPEVLSGRPWKWVVDVYSFGILVYTMITKQIPYEGKGFETAITLAMLVVKGTRPDLPANLDMKWRCLIENCWSGSPDARPSWSQICQRLGGIEFVSSFNHSDRSKFLEYRKRVSPSDLVFSDA